MTWSSAERESTLSAPGTDVLRTPRAAALARLDRLTLLAGREAARAFCPQALASSFDDDHA